MLLLIKEVTVDGDGFGFSKGANNTRTNRAIRTFKLQVDGDPVTYIDDCLRALPKFGDAHPSYRYCYVSDIDCTALPTDPHIYEARVTYEKRDVNDDGIDPEDTIPEDTTESPKYPWLEKATISVATDSAKMEVSEMAYAYYGTMLASAAFDTDGTIKPDMANAIVTPGGPQVQILNTLSEKPANLPEEPKPALRFNIDFAVQGENLSAVWDFLQNAHTVNDSFIRLRDFGLPTYTAYMENVSCTPETYSFTSTTGGVTTTTEHPYWKVSLVVAARRDTWVFLMANTSYNYKTDDNSKQPIVVLDTQSNVPSPITEPMRIDIDSKPIDVDIETKLLKEPRPSNAESVVNMYLLKRPSDWSGMFSSIPF